MKRARDVAEAVWMLHAALPKEWEPAPGERRVALAQLREAATVLVEAAHLAVHGTDHQAKHAAALARRAHEAATGHGADLRTCMYAIEAVNLAAQDPERAEVWRAGMAATVPSEAFAAAVSAWRGEARGVRKWDGIAAMLRRAGLGRRRSDTLHRQWKAWRSRSRGDL